MALLLRLHDELAPATSRAPAVHDLVTELRTLPTRGGNAALQQRSAPSARPEGRPNISIRPLICSLRREHPLNDHEVPAGVRAPRLRQGDRVRIVAPASPPTRDGVARGVKLLTSWGLQVEIGPHVFDRWGYMAGRDEDRAADLNSAFRDPGVRAIFTARGGKGAYRIVDDLDLVAARRDPKPLVGFSDISHVHLALWARAGLASLHGPFANWSDEWTGPASAEALRSALMTTESVVLQQQRGEVTTPVTVDGTATGVLVGAWF